MKKGKRLIGLLLCSTLITAHYTSGTYAKYTSSMETTDTARAARWGINVENEVDLFHDSVIQGLKGSSTNDDNIIAPGTSGEYTFMISGTSETAYKIDIDAELEDYTGGRIHYYWDGEEMPTGADLVSVLETALSNNKVYAPGCDLENTQGKHTIGWKWEYEEQKDVDGNLYDKEDTNLGIKADTYLKDNLEPDKTTPSDEVPGVKLKVSITAVQVTNHTGSYAAC